MSEALLWLLVCALATVAMFLAWILFKMLGFSPSLDEPYELITDNDSLRIFYLPNDPREDPEEIMGHGILPKLGDLHPDTGWMLVQIRGKQLSDHLWEIECEYDRVK